MKDQISRKEFLQYLMFGVTAVGLQSVITSCSGGSKEDTPQTTAQKTTPAPKPSVASDPCADTSGLTEAELTMRTNLKYVAESPEEGKLCDNCNFWTDPEAGQACGGCQLIKGPIHAKGYCISWVAKET